MEKKFLITNNDISVSCNLSAPDSGSIQRVVLGVHGIAGSANDRIQSAIAEEMAMFHSATVRFDFPGHGNSPVEDLTLEDCQKSLLATAAWAKAQYPQVEDLCIFATGFGAYVTLLCLQELTQMPGKIRLVIQTPAVQMHDTLLTMLSLTQQTFRSMEFVTLPLPRPLKVTYQLYKEIAASSALISHPIPMLILHGEEDAYIRMEDVQHFHRINEQSKLVIIPGTSHRFMEDGAWDMVLDLTRDWFEFEQVLLADWD